MKKVNQKDIAESLNLSRVTVTKALQDHPEIAKETIRRVKERANEMGYIPDNIGRSLASNRTYTIGLVVPKIAHSFFSYSIERMYAAARLKGYTIMPTVSFEDSEQELENIRTLLSMRVDGIILDLAQNEKKIFGYELARRAGCKVLFYDRRPGSFNRSSIVTNDMESSYEVTRVIIEKGYRRICHLAGPSYLNISQDRKAGYEKAMQEAGLPVQVFQTDLTREGGKIAFDTMIKSGENPEAVFAVNDPVAHGVYDAVGDLDLSIPGDIAVAGFGDLSSSALLQPTMTSIRPPIDEMAGSAVEMVIKMIEDDLDEFETRIFDASVIIREST